MTAPDQQPPKPGTDDDRLDVPRDHTEARVRDLDGPGSISNDAAQERAKGARYRATWTAHYASFKGEATTDETVLELSRVMAAATFHPSIVEKLEGALELEPGELLSGAFFIPRAALGSLEAEVTIFHPRRCRFVSAAVKTLESDELDEIVRALSILRDWRPEASR